VYFFDARSLRVRMYLYVRVYAYIYICICIYIYIYIYIYTHARAKRYPEFKRGAAEIFTSGFRDVSFFAFYTSFWLQWISGGYNARCRDSEFLSRGRRPAAAFFSSRFLQTFKTSPPIGRLTSAFAPLSSRPPGRGLGSEMHVGCGM